LNACELSTRAGRRLLAGESVKGKGTTTTPHVSQVTERLVIFGRIPLTRHSGGKSALPPGVKRLHLSPPTQPVLLELVDEHAPRLYPQTLADLLRNGDLPLRGNLTGVHHCLLTSLLPASRIACSRPQIKLNTP